MNDGSISAGLDTARTVALTQHYQKTFELVLHYWENRNRQFLMLAGLIAATALATIFQHPLLAAIGNYLKGNNLSHPDLVTALPLAYRVVVVFLLVAVFYLMATLYHRSGVIINYYQYLGVLERRIRGELRLGPDEIEVLARRRVLSDHWLADVSLDRHFLQAYSGFRDLAAVCLPHLVRSARRLAAARRASTGCRRMVWVASRELFLRDRCYSRAADPLPILEVHQAISQAGCAGRAGIPAT